MNQLYKTERETYPHIKSWLEEQLKTRFTDFYLEITADRKFSNTLKQQIDRNRDLIFNFLKEAAPDITGFVKGDYSKEFIVVEIKNKPIKLEDIYQSRKYAELFDARYALLVSTKEIRNGESIKAILSLKSRITKTQYSVFLLLKKATHCCGFGW